MLNNYLQKSGNEKVNEDIIFRISKLEENETPVYKVKLASVYQSMFGITKDVSYLVKAEELLTESNKFYKEQNAGVILKEAGEEEKANKLLNYAKEASFELGPVTVRDIDSKL